MKKNLDIRIEDLQELFPNEDCVPAIKIFDDSVIESDGGMVRWAEIPQRLDQVDEDKIQKLEVNHLMHLLPGILLGLFENRDDRSQILAYKLVLKLKSDFNSANYQNYFSVKQFNCIVEMFDSLLIAFELFDDYEHIWLFRAGFTTIDPETPSSNG